MRAPLADAAERRRALAELDANLLVEAAAGTGKTSLLAARAAMLMARGVPPREIAAITYTEAAAGELAQRVRQAVGQLLAGQVPAVLEPMFPTGSSGDELEALGSAEIQLDELTTTTIHGFCQRLVQAYAVDADLDPGATVLDADQQDAMFEEVLKRWLAARLSGPEDEDDPVGILAQDDPLGAVAKLRELAMLRRRHRTARAPEPDHGLRPDSDFLQAVDDFRRWFSSGPAEPVTGARLDQLGQLAAYYDGTLAGRPTFAELLRLTRPPRSGLMKGDGLEWRAYQATDGWRRMAGAGGPALAAEASALDAECGRAFRALLGHLAGRLVWRLSASLDEVLSAYGREKRAAAALDFDDLIDHAAALVRDHEPIRQALGRRYPRVLVDELQDTDPLQAEIIFSIAAAEKPSAWPDAALRPGSLFLVGDPKQAIYRFRGADVGAYRTVREAFEARGARSVISITANFRSAPGILAHVNGCFERTLRQPDQPRYVALEPVLEAAEGGRPCVAKLTVDLPPRTPAGVQRNEEASSVAGVCRRLIGALDVRRDDGTFSPLRPGDIALLAPTSTELWRYEQELERAGLSVASQAGRSLLRTQEAQDLLALALVLADRHDTLAFGALMRGPLVGLTEGKLLAIAAALPPLPDGAPASFDVTTPPEQVSDPVAPGILSSLAELRRRAALRTPAVILAEAVELLNVRVALTLRAGDRSARALSNLDALLTRARRYDVAGLLAFAKDLQADWQGGADSPEGRSDDAADAVSLVTMHGAKGLEWPVVIPINAATRLRGPAAFVHRQSDDSLHWRVGGLSPPDLAVAQAEEAQRAARERERLWYVACTRARDLLILPDLPAASDDSWARAVDVGLAGLGELDLSVLRPATRQGRAATECEQTPELFAEQAAGIARSCEPTRWRAPSLHDRDREGVAPGLEAADAVNVAPIVGAGRARGVLLHKLMEELITGEAAVDRLGVRAEELLSELAAREGLALGTDLPSPRECAAAALRTWELAEVAALRGRLVAEWPVFGSDEDGTFVAGRLDAASLHDGAVETILDWKSDVARDARRHRDYAAQLSDYIRLTGAQRAGIVYMTLGIVVWQAA